MSNSEQLKGQMLQSMRRLASSVAVVSTANGQEPENRKRCAMAATSVTSLSMDPPSLLVCVNKSTVMHETLDEGVDFCINLLGAEHEDVSSACGGRLKGDERFTVGNWGETEAGLPYLTDAQSVIVLEQDGRYEYGSHTIFIGKVKEVQNSDAVSPLIYVDGRYATATEPEAA